MKRTSLPLLLVCMLSLATWPACKQPYLPPVTKAKGNFLVVDGFINGGTDSTVFLLSRTRNLSDSILLQPELRATVYVESAGGLTYQLSDFGNGRYAIPRLTLQPGETYRLHILTAGGEEYTSGYVPVKAAPPIDSLSWRADSLGVTVSVNTHDPANSSRYYRWQYDETWEYRSSYQSFFDWDWQNQQLVLRDSSNQVYSCWRSQASTDILLGSSAKLSQDVIRGYRLTSVPRGSEKLSYIYSLHVRQYALTQEAFSYWDNLRKNTEQRGSLYDPQPSQVPSNLHNLRDSTEPVFGFVSACITSEARLFIDNHNGLVPHWGYVPYYADYGCDNRTIPPDSINYFIPGTYPPQYTLVGTPTGPGYIITPARCADCRLHGGTNQKPDYWP
ncbi:MAG TPA: DUF4249 domain-containing protein [Chitinophagaceae bacterium]|nr:DUF4249 domain-containing protein [Chitinophagaceae bacterium]